MSSHRDDGLKLAEERGEAHHAGWGEGRGGEDMPDTDNKAKTPPEACALDPFNAGKSLDSPPPTVCSMRDPENEATLRKQRDAPGGTGRIPDVSDDDKRVNIEMQALGRGIGGGSLETGAESTGMGQVAGAEGASADGASRSGGREDVRDAENAAGTNHSAELHTGDNSNNSNDNNYDDNEAKEQGSDAAKAGVVDDRLEMGVSALMLMFNSTSPPSESSSSSSKRRRSCR
jgi:hypothetical protein